MSALGDILDNLGVTGDLEEGDLADSAMVLLKVIDSDGDVRLSLFSSEGMSWIERRGMIETARDGEITPPDDFRNVGE